MENGNGQILDEINIKMNNGTGLERTGILS